MPMIAPHVVAPRATTPFRYGNQNLKARFCRLARHDDSSDRPVTPLRCPRRPARLRFALGGAVPSRPLARRTVAGDQRQPRRRPVLLPVRLRVAVGLWTRQGARPVLRSLRPHPLGPADAADRARDRDQRALPRRQARLAPRGGAARKPRRRDRARSARAAFLSSASGDRRPADLPAERGRNIRCSWSSSSTRHGSPRAASPSSRWH